MLDVLAFRFSHSSIMLIAVSWVDIEPMRSDRAIKDDAADEYVDDIEEGWAGSSSSWG